MNALSDFEISELAAQLVCGEFEIRLEADKKLHSLNTGMQTSVYVVMRPLAEEKLHKARESNDPDKIVQELQEVAVVAQHLDDYATARILMDACIDLEKRLDRGWPFPYSLAAWMLQEQGDLSRAREYQEEAVRIARNEFKSDGITAVMLYRQGTIAVAQGELEYSRRCFAESIGFRHAWKYRFPESDEDRLLFLIYAEYAKILLAHEQAIPAIQLLAAAQRIGERINEAKGFHEHALFLALLAQAREIAEESAFDLAWNEGLSMTSEEIDTQIIYYGQS